MYNNNQEVLDRMKLNSHQRGRAAAGHSGPGEDCSIPRLFPVPLKNFRQRPLYAIPVSLNGAFPPRTVVRPSGSYLIRSGSGKSGTRVTSR